MEETSARVRPTRDGFVVEVDDLRYGTRDLEPYLTLSARQRSRIPGHGAHRAAAVALLFVCVKFFCLNGLLSET